jgi:Protein ENHANCED DISEASE RESISTANCE 2, C-terminal
VQQTYFRGAGYFEIDVDIGCGNVLVQSILNVVRDKAKWLTVDLHFVIEGENEVSVT